MELLTDVFEFMNSNKICNRAFVYTYSNSHFNNVHEMTPPMHAATNRNTAAYRRLS